MITTPKQNLNANIKGSTPTKKIKPKTTSQPPVDKYDKPLTNDYLQKAQKAQKKSQISKEKIVQIPHKVTTKPLALTEKKSKDHNRVQSQRQQTPDLFLQPHFYL